MTHEIPSDSVIIKMEELEYLKRCEMKMMYFEKMINELKKENFKLKKQYER
ncbi:MAG: hypothetical protein ACOC2W_01445 [bacterium]